MMKLTMQLAALGCALALPAAAATDVTLHLNGSEPLQKLTAKFACDQSGVGMGLPSGTFTVQYLRSGDTSLAILPVKGQDLVFAQVISANGGRYVTGRLTWWDAREPVFIQDADAKQPTESKCRRVN
jgi:membrane-bound inhibitor of C-type lysozyme